MIIQDLLHPDLTRQHLLIKGLVPATWTQPNEHQKEIKASILQEKATILINKLNHTFRTIIWNSWCKMRKQWEKRQLNQADEQTYQQLDTTSSPKTAFQHTLESIYQLIMNAQIERPTIVCNHFLIPNHSTASS